MKLEKKIYYDCPYCKNPLLTYRTRKGYLTLCPSNLCLKIFHVFIKHVPFNCTHSTIKTGTDKFGFPFARCSICLYTVFNYRAKPTIEKGTNILPIFQELSKISAQDTERITKTLKTILKNTTQK